MTPGIDLSIGPRLKSVREDDLCVQILPVELEQVVGIKGSFRTNPRFARGEHLIQDLAVALLEEGTTKRDKQTIATFLEDRGAFISFSASGPRVRFSARCLKRDLWQVLDVLAEQLHRPAFPQKEFDLLVQRRASSLLRRKSETGSRASRLLSRKVYQQGHPLCRALIEEELEQLMSLRLEEVVAFATAQFGRCELNIVGVGDLGDVDPQEVARPLAGDWMPLGPGVTDYPEGKSEKMEAEHIELPDRPNLDVRIGQSLTVRRADPDYLALSLGCLVLGGNFSSRLMSTVRDQEGLTYGIRSSLSGVDRLHTGSWITSVTLSLDNLDRGIASTMNQIRLFTSDGISQEELEDAKTTMTGSYEVNLADTEGISQTILSHREQGFSDTRIDSWPLEVERLSLEEVNQAVATHLDPERLVMTSAGTKFPGA